MTYTFRVYAFDTAAAAGGAAAVVVVFSQSIDFSWHIRKANGAASTFNG